jgi:cell division protein FtsB
MKERDEISSDESIEKIAREKLGMVKDGERVFVDTNK